MYYTIRLKILALTDLFIMNKLEEEKSYLNAIILDLLIVTLDYLTQHHSERRKKIFRLQLLEKFFLFPEEQSMVSKFQECHDWLCDKTLDIESNVSVLKKHSEYSYL